uniref:Endosome-associated-trafficking regulator 1 n=1 Tax=Myotis myotis TaxID=51298 RepID=A0A7J7ZXW2_MYOMY|nr:hypothetical protein mMyoMyo1_009778 [Myotis myotis]
MIKEESAYHNLESVVQQVEQNLELITKCAVKVESHVMKQTKHKLAPGTGLKLQAQEQPCLGQGTSMMVVKQNRDLALQNLSMFMNNRHSSIKQLVSGAQTFNLVAEILKSIDRISEIKEDGRRSLEKLLARSSVYILQSPLTGFENAFVSVNM